MLWLLVGWMITVDFWFVCYEIHDFSGGNSGAGEIT